MNQQTTEDYLEMLMNYLQSHHERGYGDILWDLFADDYPDAANDESKRHE